LKWTKEEVASWLMTIGFGRVAVLFLAKNIDGNAMKQLSELQLKRIISDVRPSFGHE
jgi:hypothetical protein